MKTVYIFLYLFSLHTFGQNEKLDIKIISITYKDSIPSERTYNITYQLENLSKNSISFFLNTRGLNSMNIGSMNNKPIYKILQNDTIINLDFVLSENKKSEEIAFMKALKIKREKETNFNINRGEIENENLDSILTIFGNKRKNYFEKLSKEKNLSLMKNLISLNSKETKTITKQLFWDKNRYTKNEENEYYIDEGSNHYFEITLILLKNEFKEQLTINQYNQITSDANFINAVITSNKYKIDFSE
jgi:hypothetical protein